MNSNDIESIVRPLRRSLGLFEAALAVVDDSIAVFTDKGKLIWCNKSFEVFTGESRLELLGKTVDECLIKFTSENGTLNIYEKAKEIKSEKRNMLIKDTNNAKTFVIESHFTTYEKSEEAFTMVIKDVTDKYNAQTYEKKVVQLAEEVETCSLTGILNRRGVMKQINNAIANKGMSGFYLIFCDVDNFKRINDTQGHDIGDKVLKALSNILKKCIRQSDFIGRISGDEFIIGVITNERDESAPEFVCRRILAEVAKGILFRRSDDKVKLDLSVSLGIADSKEATDSQALLHMADTAMYKAKKDSSGLSFYNKQIKTKDKFRGFLKKVSEDVFRKSKIPFHIQPIVDIQTGKTKCFEVLIRATTREGILIPTEEFVHMHELNGEIEALDLLVLECVCKTITTDFLEDGNKFLTINVSAVNIGSKIFITKFMKRLSKSKFNKNQIVVEITETAYIDDNTMFRRGINYLNDEGITVLLDDFGFGNTSCDELINLPIGGFKVDSKIFNASKKNQKALSMLRFLSEFGKENNMLVIVEGVEDNDDLLHAEKMGFRYIQGYKLSPPFPYQYFLRDPDISEKNGLSCPINQKISHPYI